MGGRRAAWRLLLHLYGRAVRADAVESFPCGQVALPSGGSLSPCRHAAMSPDPTPANGRPNPTPPYPASDFQELQSAADANKVFSLFLQHKERGSEALAQVTNLMHRSYLTCPAPVGTGRVLPSPLAN